MAPIPYDDNAQGKLGNSDATSAMVVVFSAPGGSATTFTTTPVTTQFVTTTFVTNVSISTKSLVTLHVEPTSISGATVSVITLPINPVPLSFTLSSDFTSTELRTTFPGTLTINDLNSYHIATPTASGNISSPLSAAHNASSKIGIVVGVVISVFALIAAMLVLLRRRRRIRLGGTSLAPYDTPYPGSRDLLYQRSNELVLSLEEGSLSRDDAYSDAQRSEWSKLTRERNAARTALVTANSSEQGELERYVQDLERRLLAMQSRLDAAEADGEQPPPYVLGAPARVQSTTVSSDKH